MSTSSIPTPPVTAAQVFSLPKGNAAIATGVTALLFGVLFARPAQSLAEVWWTDPNNGHGLLLAPLSLWLAWKAGKAPKASPQIGLGLLMLFMAIAARYAADLDKAGGYDAGLRLSEDYELWTRVAEHGLYAHVAQSTVRRRIHFAQASKRFQTELVRAWWDVRRRVVARRLTAAAAAQRERTLRLLESACQTDIDWAIWTGDATLLAIVREELQATERSYSATRRLAQDVRCAGKSLLQSVRGSR